MMRSRAHQIEANLGTQGQSDFVPRSKRTTPEKKPFKQRFTEKKIEIAIRNLDPSEIHDLYEAFDFDQVKKHWYVREETTPILLDVIAKIVDITQPVPKELLDLIDKVSARPFVHGSQNEKRREQRRDREIAASWKKHDTKVRQTMKRLTRDELMVFLNTGIIFNEVTNRCSLNFKLDSGIIQKLKPIITTDGYITDEVVETLRVIYQNLLKTN